MASFTDLIELICRFAESNEIHLTKEACRSFSDQARQRFGGERIYIPPPATRKDPARAEAIRQAAKTLPTGVVSARFGVSRQYVHKVVKK